MLLKGINQTDVTTFYDSPEEAKEHVDPVAYGMDLAVVKANFGKNVGADTFAETITFGFNISPGGGNVTGYEYIALSGQVKDLEVIEVY